MFRKTFWALSTGVPRDNMGREARRTQVMKIIHNELCTGLGGEGPAEPLAADLLDDTWTVVDPKGGRWFPSEEASNEIMASADPAAAAVRIAHESPMRGQWRS